MAWGLGSAPPGLGGAAALGRHLDAVIVPVGAAFDFLAGTKREAPGWLRETGFEWLFRLATEPRRLWRRYLTRQRRLPASGASARSRRSAPPAL